MEGTPRFIGLTATIICGIAILLDGFDDIAFTINYTALLIFMGIALPGAGAYDILKNRTKNT